MKFSIKDQGEKRKLSAEWHDHFAALPVRVSPSEIRWLERVKRRVVQIDCGSGWSVSKTEYRAA